MLIEVAKMVLRDRGHMTVERVARQASACGYGSNEEDEREQRKGRGAAELAEEDGSGSDCSRSLGSSWTTTTGGAAVESPELASTGGAGVLRAT